MQNANEIKPEGQDVGKEDMVVVLANAVVDPVAVVIELVDATVAGVAVS
jgi:hypothetical protein